MTISTVPASNATIVRVEGELDAVSSPQLKALLNEHVSSGATHLIVDLSAVSFIDSSGLGSLVSGLKAAKLGGGYLALVGLQEQARMIFEITMAHRIFDIFDDVDSALAKLEH